MNGILEKELPAEQEEKKRYWRETLTGDLNSLPQEVKQSAGIDFVSNPEDESKLSRAIMHSWAVDHLNVSKEEVRQNWGDIRKSLSKELNTDENDHQLFMALSQKNTVDDETKKRFYQLYSDAYNEALISGKKPQEGSMADSINGLPDHLRGIAVSVINRAADDGEIERKRLTGAANDVWKGIQGVLVNENDPGREKESWFARNSVANIVAKNIIGHGSKMNAVSSLEKLSPEDRQKVYAMLAPLARQKGTLSERMLDSAFRGGVDLLENTAQFGVNTYARLARGVEKRISDFTGGDSGAAGGYGDSVAESSRIYEELKRFSRDEIAPLHQVDSTFIDDVLVDAAGVVPMSAMAFGGPMGIGLIATSETGRHMGDARQMNPEGDYDAQMAASYSSGVVNALLSLGMSKLGVKVAEKAFFSFKAASSGTVSAAMKSLGRGAVHASGDMGMMAVENKLQELSQFGAQEVAAALTGKESGVPWEDWKQRNTSLRAQLREAGAMFPILMIGAGKVSLRHFNDSRALVGNGEYLSKLGIPYSEVTAIMNERDLGEKNRLLTDSLRNSPLWGSLFLGKKAFEWAKLLEDAESPLFKTEQEARDFLNMGPIKAEKPWAKFETHEAFSQEGKVPDHEFQAQLINDRWMMRSGLPRVEALKLPNGEKSYKAVYGEGIKGKEIVGSNPAEVLRHWNESELHSEISDLGIINDLRGDGLPPRLRESAPFDPNADTVRKSYLSHRMQDIIYRPYRMMLLKYSPETVSAMKWDAETCDQKTSACVEEVKSVLFEGVMRLAEGQPWESVSKDVSGDMWSKWLGDDKASQARSKEWLESARNSLEEGKINGNEQLRRALSVLDSDSPPENHAIAEALSAVSEYFSGTTERERALMPLEFREMSRLVWKSQGDVRSLFSLLPNLSDFDALVGRGFGPDQAYSRLLQQHLDIDPAAVARNAGRLPLEQINPGDGVPRAFKYYEFVDDALDLLGHIDKKNMQKITGADGEPLWRIKYPNGKFSAWHESEQLARQDLAGHLATMFSTEGNAKMNMVPFLIRNERKGGMFVNMQDINVHRLKEGKSGGVLFDQLAEHASADLIKWNFGKRSKRLPGEDITVHGVDSPDAESILGKASIKARGGVYRKYVGPIEEMGIDASNNAETNIKGLLLHRIDLFNKKNPLALIEDKAEVVWDRLIRSGQLSEKDAWQALHALKRVDHGGDPGNMMHDGQYMTLIEELSQISKEYYLGNLDHPFVPPSVESWGKYAVARPMPTKADMEKIKAKARESLHKKPQARTDLDNKNIDEWVQVVATEEMRNLAMSAPRLKEQLKEGALPQNFIAMLKDSVGMNENASIERFWGLRNIGEDNNCLPMSERYMHGIYQGNLPDVLPEHILNDLYPKLARLAGVDGDSPHAGQGDIKETARQALQNLAERLQDTPEISSWGMDENGSGTYRMLVRKGDKAGIFRDVPLSHDRVIGEAPVWQRQIDSPKVQSPAKITNDYYFRKMRELPSKWAGRNDIKQAIETLSLIRDELDNRPLPTEKGIYWKGKIYNNESLERPSGIPSGWIVDSPLLSGILPILELEQQGNPAKGTHTPMLIDPVASMETMKNCVMYVDPEDRRHTVRLMPGVPEAPNKEARAPYIVHAYHGILLDASGKPVPAGEMRRSYIPLELFKDSSVDIPFSEGEVAAYRRDVTKKLLDELCDHSLQKKRWWDADEGDGTLIENVIKLYEEMGVSTAYSSGQIDLHDPSFVETLRFVGHILNAPGALSSSLESGMPFHDVILSEAQALRRFYMNSDDAGGEKIGHGE